MWNIRFGSCGRASLTAVVAISLALGCSGTSASPLPDTARLSDAVFFVENHGNDGRELEQIIARTLRARGLDAVGGGIGTRPEKVDFIVRYVDRWGWDMRVFLRLIEISVSNAQTGQIVASSRSYQDSLSAMGKSFAEIIERTTNQLLDGTP